MEFSIWGANLSGGFLRAHIDQETEGSYSYNRKLIQIADHLQVDSILFPVGFTGNIGGTAGGSGQLDPLTIAAALAAETEHIHLIAAVFPGLVHPATLAKIGSTLDIVSNGRFHINLVSSWSQEEQEMFGLEWIGHEERYKRSEEYLQVLKGLWTENHFSFDGDYYQIKDASLTPKPVQEPYPAIYQGGDSPEAQELAGRHSDYYFLNGAPAEELIEQIAHVRSIAARHGREIKFAVNAFVIAREHEADAKAELDYIIKHADETAINQFRQRNQAEGIWEHAETTGEFVANNEGFRTGLIGSYQQVAAKIEELERIGIDQILLTFRFPVQELPLFYNKVVSRLHNRRFRLDYSI